MNRDLMAAIRHEWLKSLIAIGTFGLAIFLLMALASPVQAQRFDDVIRDALDGFGCPNINQVPLGNLDQRICNQVGTPGTSSGSPSMLSREIVPIEERRVQRLIGPFNVFFSGEYERFEKDVTKFEPGYTTNTGRVLIGADYPWSNGFVLGAAFRYAHDNGKFDSTDPVNSTRGPIRAGQGRFNTDAYSALLYANFLPATNFFIDTSVGYTRKNSFIRRGVVLGGGSNRPVGGTADGDTDGNEYTVEVKSGYNFNFKNITFGPRLGLNHRHTEIHGYRERGRVTFDPNPPLPPAPPGTGLELIFNNQHESSLTSALGMYGSLAINTGFGVLIPQTTLEYVHEFLDPQRTIKFRFVEDQNRNPFRFENDPPDRNYFNLGAGISAQLPYGFAPFLNYRALVGYKDQLSHTVTAGLRIEF